MNKTLRKLLTAIFATLLTITSFVSLGHVAAQDDEAAVSDTLAVVIPAAEHGWLAGVAYYAEQKIEELGLENYTIVTSSNVNEQASQLDELIAQEVGAVVILPHTDEVTLSAQKVLDADIPLIVFDRRVDVDYTAYVAGSNPQIGEFSADYLGEQLEGAGIIAILNNPSAGSVSSERVDEFKRVMEEDYPEIELIDFTVENFTQETGLTAATDLLTANPQIDAIFSIDDESSLGILQAIMDAQREDVRFLSGAGGNQAYFSEINDAEDISLFTATYSPAMIGDAIEVAFQIMNGEEVEKDQIVEPTIVNKDNVADFLDADSPY